jgi:hypothetical protein
MKNENETGWKTKLKKSQKCNWPNTLNVQVCKYPVRIRNQVTKKLYFLIMNVKASLFKWLTTLHFFVWDGFTAIQSNYVGKRSLHNNL